MTPNDIRKRMMDYEVKQADICRLCGVKSSMVYDVVMGYRRSRRIMQCMADLLEVQVDELFPPKPKRRFVATPSERGEKSGAEVA